VPNGSSKQGTPYDVIVIGGGAAGMMAAIQARTRGKSVLLLEKNTALGNKLAISGGGRCNITNAEEDTDLLLSHFGASKEFLHSAFAEFGVKDTFAFFEGLALPIVVQKGKRAFPKTERAKDVVRVLSERLRALGVEVVTNAPVARLIEKAGWIQKVVVGSEEYTAHTYICATGGLSHQETGSTGDGFRWLAELGHRIVDPTPTIVPLKVKEKFVVKMAGITIPEMKITFYLDGAKKFSKNGRLLFTHTGVSGPTILNAAGAVGDLLYEGAVTASIDTMPKADLGALDQRLTELFDHNKNKALKNVFKEIAPPGASETFLSLVPEIDIEKKVHSVTKEERKILGRLLKNIPLTITGLMGFDVAVVADGGVPLTEVDMRSMRSKIIKNLLLTGDLLNIRRPSGGYSLQLCWTTGFVAGNNA
jgi:predicted Rossmann fold flavoprotein